jgi:hypothetical protein
MQYRYGFLARAADVMPDGSFAVLGGGYNYLVLGQLPGFANMAIITAFGVDSADYGREHRFALDIHDPSGKSTFRLEGSGCPERSSEFASAKLDFVFVFNVTNDSFADAGEYQFKISLDGADVGFIPLLIKQQGTRA